MKKKYYQILFLVSVAFLVPLFTTAQVTTIPVGTTTRSMILYVPPALPANRPLVISMHGSGQGADYQQGQSKWELVADTAKFVLVYPSGINKQWDISGNSDINFILAIIDTMQHRYSIDRNRVYLSGFSLGGMMTYHAATRIADKIAAFGPVSGYPPGGANYNSSRPVSIIHVHGTADDVVPYNNVISYLNGWVTRDQCPATPQITQPYPANKPNSIATKRYWGPGAQGAEIVLLTLAGKGHWHSLDTVNGINTSIEIWNFCKRFSLNKAIQENTTGFCSLNGTIDTDHTGYTGTGFANTTNAAGSGITWKVNFASSGNKTFTFRYASTDNRPGNLVINGATALSNINFPSTGSWDTWSTVSVTIPANAGIVNVRLEAAGSNGLGNIDYLEVTGGTAADCSAITARTGSNATTAAMPDVENSSVNKDIVVTPNPAKNTVKVMLHPYWKTGDNITIYNAAGNQILTRPLRTSVEEFNTASLPAGIYIIQVSNKESQKITRQFIKTRD
jgi:poly(hydroxyalkanoate) depolymerase family esterase